MARVDSIGKLKKRQKKINKRKLRRQKPRRTIFVVILIVIFVGAIVLLSNTVLFRINNIEVRGNERYQAEEITSLIGIHMGENLFRINPEPEEKRVLSVLPYIDEITISRKFPNTLLVTVKEENAAYKVDTGNYTGILLSADGRVLEKVNDFRLYDVTEVVGLNTSGYEVGNTLDDEKNEDKVHMVCDIITYLGENGIGNIKYIDINDKYDIRLNYNLKIRIYLGEPSELEDKIIMLAGVLERIHETESGTIDIRSTSTAFFNPSN